MLGTHDPAKLSLPTEELRRRLGVIQDGAAREAGAMQRVSLANLTNRQPDAADLAALA